MDVNSTRRLKVNDDNDWTTNLDFELSDDTTINITAATADTTAIPMSSWSTDTITIGSNPNTTFTISNGDNMLKFDDDDITITTHEPVDFVDQLPTLNKIQAMCTEYPGLSKAFDNFKITYKMVHQDWIGKNKAK